MMLLRITVFFTLVISVLLTLASQASPTHTTTSTHTLFAWQTDLFVAQPFVAINDFNIAASAQTFAGQVKSLTVARDVVIDQSAVLVIGLLIGLAILALFISVALKLRQSAAVFGICLSLIVLVLHINTHQIASFGELDAIMALCFVLLTLFAADISLALHSRRNQPTIATRVIRAYQVAMIVLAFVVVLMPAEQISSWSVTLVLTCMCGFAGFSIFAGRHLINGKALAIFMLIAWGILFTVLARILLDQGHAFDVVFNWAVATVPMVLAFGFSYNSLSYRIRWLRNLKETARAGELLNIERSHRGFFREVESFLGDLNPNSYEEAILSSFLTHLDSVVPVAASAVAISHRGSMRLVTRFKDGNAENFSSVLETRETLLQSICLTDQAAVIHSDELGLSTNEDTISTLCIVPLKLEREDWCGVILARSFDMGFHIDEMRLVKEFSEHAQSALANAVNFGKVRRQAEIDSLTNLFNRGAIMGRAERMFKKSRSMGAKYSVLFVDIDKFKEINDTYGHAVGDMALKQIAEICELCLRENDKVGRYGGEEFIVLLPNADAENAQRVAERIRASIESAPLQMHDETVGLTVSIGISEMASRFKDFNGMLRAADRALYCAKREGRNRVVHHLYMLRGDTVRIGFK